MECLVMVCEPFACHRVFYDAMQCIPANTVLLHGRDPEAPRPELGLVLVKLPELVAAVWATGQVPVLSAEREEPMR